MQTNIVAMNPQLVAWLCGDGIELSTIDLWLLWLSYPITVTSSSACIVAAVSFNQCDVRTLQLPWMSRYFGLSQFLD